MARTLESQLYGVRSGDPLALIAASFVFAVAGLAARVVRRRPPGPIPHQLCAKSEPSHSATAREETRKNKT
jgi:hypothetical protein